MNSIIENIKTRRSVRRYNQEQIKPEIIEQIVEAGAFAPSGHNTQPWHFTVVQNKELIDKISVDTKEILKKMDNPVFKKMGESKRFHLLYNAPTIIVISGDPVNSFSMDADLGAATQNMLLAAYSLGVCSCWVGLVTPYFEGDEKENILKEMKIPNGFNPQYVITLGYPRSAKSVQSMAAPKRRQNIVTYIK